ncbi:MAG: glycosyltransferase family 4 protein [Planctomyces sp.]|nr:glycosyltransferase family 4 protein [Planctomyces sp.]
MTSSPKALFVAPSGYPLGGVATWLDYLIPGLRRHGWDATLGLVSGPRHHDARTYLDQHPCETAVVIGCETGTRRGRIAAVSATLQRLRPDVVVSANIPDALLAVESVRRRGGPAARGVMSCHGIEPDLYDDMALMRDALDAVICTNRLASELAVRLGGLDPERSLYACYGTDLPADVPIRAAGTPLTLAFVGRIEQPQKRVLDLTPLAAALRSQAVSFRIQVAGAGPLAGELKREAQAADVLGTIDFLGRLGPGELVDRVYRRADALLLTSSWETGPIVIWEAMAHGCAVITSDYVGNRREGALRHEENCLMFPVGDMKAAAEQARRLATEPGLRERLVRAGRELVEERYSVEASIEQWSRVLTSIVDRPARRCGTLPLDDGPRGRLDRWLGPGAAGRVRRLMGRRPPDAGPGGEWPHSLSKPAVSKDDFLAMAAEADRAEDGAAVCRQQQSISC